MIVMVIASAILFMAGATTLVALAVTSVTTKD